MCRKSISLTAHFGVLVGVVLAVGFPVAEPPLGDTPARLTPEFAVRAVFV